MRQITPSFLKRKYRKNKKMSNNFKHEYTQTVSLIDNIKRLQLCWNTGKQALSGLIVYKTKHALLKSNASSYPSVSKTLVTDQVIIGVCKYLNKIPVDDLKSEKAAFGLVEALVERELNKLQIFLIES